MRTAIIIALALAFSMALHPRYGYAESADPTPPSGAPPESTPPNEGEEAPPPEEHDEAPPPEERDEAPSPEDSDGSSTEEEGDEEPPPEEGDDSSTEAESDEEHRDEPPPLDAPEAPTPLPPVIGLPGTSLDVAFVESVNGLQPGDRLEPSRSVLIPEGGCLRLVAGLSAAVSLCGPTRAELSTRERRLIVSVSSGRGLLSADADGGAIAVAGHHVEVRGGTVSFETGGAPLATLVSGEVARIDGEALDVNAAGPDASELLSSSFCAPPLTAISIALGDPAGLTSETSQARAQGGEGGDEAATAEGGATCVDSADSSAATDPNQGTDGGIDPDARRNEPGRLRLTIRLPR